MERRDRRFNNGLDEFIDENYAKICNNLEEEIINILSLMETNLIIEHGITIKGKSLKEHLEVKG